MLTFDHKEPKQLAECTNIIVKIPETTVFPTRESIYSSGDWIRILYIYMYIYVSTEGRFFVKIAWVLGPVLRLL